MSKSIGILVVVLLAAAAQGAVLSTPADMDNTLQGDGDYNSGAQGLMNADLRFGGAFEGRRALLHFDISSIGAGQQIDSAVLHVLGHATADNATGKAFKVYRVTTEWSEGTKTAGATLAAGEVGSTRTYARNELGDPAGKWTSLMGDFDAGSVVSYTATANRLDIDITGIVQSWYDGDNFGLIIVADQAGAPGAWGATRQNFYTREDGNSNNWPSLDVTYSESAIPEPVTMSLLALGAIGILARRKRPSGTYPRVRR